MFAEFDKFKRLEKPVMTLCNPSDEEIGEISYFNELVISPVFNAVSELSFSTPKIAGNLMYNYFVMKRQILVSGLGYFTITSVSEVDTLEGVKKNISATSGEIELNNIALPYIPDGTYALYNTSYPVYNVNDPIHSLWHQIKTAMPAWDIDDSNLSSGAGKTLADSQRTFESADGNIYPFIVNKIAESYECIAEFNILTRKIKFIPKVSALNTTTIFLSRENIADEVEVSENSDEYANAIYVTGGDDSVGIGAVNPMGTNVIYNFSYDIASGLMSAELVEALTGVNGWEDAFTENEASYYAKQQEMYGWYDSENTLHQGLVDQLTAAQASEYAANTIQLAAFETLGVKQASGISSEIIAAQNAYTSANNTYIALVAATAEIQADIDALSLEITAIQESLQFSQFLSPTQLTELSRCLQQASYSDENIIFTDSMNLADKLGWMKTLYDKTKNVLTGGQLNGICEPRREIKVSAQGSVFKEVIDGNSDELEVGCLIDIEMPDGEISTYILQKIDVNYDEKTIGLTFGNRFRISNPTAVFKDLYENTSGMASLVASNYVVWGQQVAKVSMLEEERTQALSINATRVINSVNQRITIGDNGAIFRSTTPEGVELEYAIRISDGTILFTKYDSETETYSAEMAVGRIVNEDSTYSYGILGGTIVSNSVTADKIVAGSIEKGTNLVKDGSFDNMAWVGRVGVGTVESTGGVDGLAYYKGTLYSETPTWMKSSSKFRVQPSMPYWAAYYYMATSSDYDSESRIQMQVRWFANEEDDEPISSSNITASTGTSPVEWDTRVSLNIVAPATANFAEVRMYASGFTGEVKFDQIMLIQSNALTVPDYTKYIGELTARYTVINDEGITVRNGAIIIKNDAEQVVFEADDDGNLLITGQIFADGGIIGGFEISDESLISGLYDGHHNPTPETFAGIIAHQNPGSRYDPAFFAGADSSTDVTAQGTISAFGGTVGVSPTRVNATVVGIASGDTVAIHSQHYEGAYVISNRDAGGFYIDKAYSVSEYGTWNKTANFSVNYGGSLYSNDANIKGNITADTLIANTSGQIGGFNIGSNLLSAGATTNYVTMSTGATAFSAGSATPSTAPFRVTNAGMLTAAGADVGGILRAGAGSTIGSWTLTGTELYSGSMHLYSDGRIAVGSNFSVSSTGVITASGANLTTANVSGTLVAGNNSRIGGWNVTMDKLSSGTVAFFSATGATNAININDIFKVTPGGAVTATSGTIGGWRLGSNSMKGGSSAGSYTAVQANGDASTYAFAAGATNETDYSTAKFNVTHTGYVTAELGTIGGWRMGSNSMKGGSSAGSYTAVQANAGVSTYAFAAGATTETDYSTAKFNVTHTGEVKAKSLNTETATIGTLTLTNPLTGYASSTHTHSGYASSTHNHDGTYAYSSHTHSELGQGGYATNVNGYAVDIGTNAYASNGYFINIGHPQSTVNIRGQLYTGSSEEIKKDIESTDNESALPLITNSKIYKYHKTGTEIHENERKSYGLIIERECPEELLSPEKDGVNLYSMISLAWKAIQELSEENKKLADRLDVLEKSKK